jgi:hypothetical protein
VNDLSPGGWNKVFTRRRLEGVDGVDYTSYVRFHFSRWVFDHSHSETSNLAHCKSLRTSPLLRDHVSFQVLLLVVEQQANRLHGMFHRDFQGDFHKDFLRALNDFQDIYNPKKNFGRIIPIIQPGSTGKSRMVREIGNDVRFPFTFLVKILPPGKVHYPRVAGPPAHATFF